MISSSHENDGRPERGVRNGFEVEMRRPDRDLPCSSQLHFTSILAVPASLSLSLPVRARSLQSPGSLPAPLPPAGWLCVLHTSLQHLELHEFCTSRRRPGPPASEPPTAEPEEPRPSERSVCGAPPLRTRLVLRCDEGVSGRSRSSRVFSATLILSMC